MAKTKIKSLLNSGSSGSLLLKGAGRSAPKDPLGDLLKQNDSTRKKLAAAGVKDPTKESKPSALERIMGPLDALGAGTRSLVYNAVSDKDVDVLAEMGKALKGEKRIEGADILDELGVDNKWAKMLGGFAVDILLDPLTYATFGFGSSAKSGGKVLLNGIMQYGDNVDDIVKATGLADDVVRGGIEALRNEGLLSRIGEIAAGKGDDAVKLSQNVMTTLYKQFGKGGVKFAGIPLGLEDEMAKAGYKAKELARKLPASKWFEQTFAIGGLAPDAMDTLRKGNEVTNQMIRALRGDEQAAFRVAELMGQRMDEALRQIVPDDAARRWAGIAYGARFGDDAKELARLSEEYRALMRAGDLGAADELYQASQKLLAEAEGRAQQNIDRILRDAAQLTDEQYDQAMAGINHLRKQMADVYAKRKPFIRMGIFGDTGDAYLPGIGKEQLDDLDREIAGRLRKESPDALDMRVQENVNPDPNFRKRKEYVNQLDRILGEKRDAGTLPVTEVIGETFDGSRLLTKRGRVQADWAANGPGLFTEADLATLGSKAVKDQAGKFAVESMEKELSGIVGGELAHRIAKDTAGFFTRDESTKGFLRIFDKVNNLWKRQATVLRFPAFQNRNLLSNKILMFQDGALSVAGEAKSLDVLQRMLAYNTGKLDDAARVAFESEIDELVRHGVLTSFEELSEQVGKTGGGNKVTKALGALNTLIENQSRISAYHTFLGKGLSPQAAGEMTSKALFDYSDEVLSVFEKNVIKRLVPFYKWTKNNLSKQTRILLESPGRSTWVGHLKESGEAVTDYDESVRPNWLRDLYPIPLPITDGGDPVMLSTAGLFPQGDLELLSGVLGGKFDPKDAFGSLSPLLRTPLELLFNKDLWYDTDIAAYEGQKKRAPQYIEVFGDLASEVPGIGDVWRFISDRLGIEERTSDDGEAYYWMNAKAVKAMRDMVPWMNNVSKVLDQSQRKSKYDNTMFLTGVKPILYDTERFRVNQAYDDRDALRQALQRAKDEGLIEKQAARTVGLNDLFGGR